MRNTGLLMQPSTVQASEIVSTWALKCADERKRFVICSRCI
jgi:hypothetical protein